MKADIVNSVEVTTWYCVAVPGQEEGASLHNVLSELRCAGGHPDEEPGTVESAREQRESVCTVCQHIKRFVRQCPHLIDFLVNMEFMADIKGRGQLPGSLVGLLQMQTYVLERVFSPTITS